MNTLHWLTVVKISGMKLLLKLRPWVCKVCLLMESFRIILSEVPCACVQEIYNAAGCILEWFWRCINAGRFVKKRHAARCIHKMQGILSVYTQKQPNQPHLLKKYQINMGFSHFHEFGSYLWCTYIGTKSNKNMWFLRWQYYINLISIFFTN